MTTKRKTTKRTATAAEKLARAQRAQDSMTVYISGNLLAEWKCVKTTFDQAKAADTGMLNPSAATKAAAKRLAELEEQMRDDSIDITVQALQRVRTPSTADDTIVFSELVDAHPPRKGADGKPVPTDTVGFNAVTFPDALIRASIIGPDDLDDTQWDMLLHEVLTDGQFDRLFEVCWRLNRSEVDVPFSSAASRIAGSAPASRRPSDSASPNAASTAGNLAKSLNTSTTTTGA